MPHRFTAAALALAASLLALAGARGLASVVLLGAVVVAAVAVLEAVSERVSARTGVAEVVLAVVALACVVTGAALRAPLLGLGTALALVPLPAVSGAEPVLSK